MVIETIDRVVPITDPKTGRATERMESFARAVQNPAGAVRALYQTMSEQSASCDNSTPGVLVGTAPRLAAKSIAVGDTLRVLFDGRTGTAGTSNNAEFSLYLNDGSSSVALASQIEVYDTAGTADIDGFRVACDVTRVSETTLHGKVSIETAAVNDGSTPYIGTYFIQSLTGPDFSLPIDIEFYGRVTNASSRTFYLDLVRVERVKSL